MKLFKRLFSMTLVAVLAIAMTVTLIPVTAAPVDAAEDDAGPAWPGMALGSRFSALQLTYKANTDDAQIVWYGGRAWYVIAGDDGIGALVGNKKIIGDGDDEKGVITLFQKELIEHCVYSTQFIPWYYTFQYFKSDLKPFIEGYTSDDPDADHAIFTKQETKNIKGRTLRGYGAGDYNEDLIGGDDVENALLWPLVMGQVKELPDKIRIVKPGGGEEDFWWTASPGHTVGPMEEPDGFDPENCQQASADAYDPNVGGDSCMCFMHVVFLDGVYEYKSQDPNYGPTPAERGVVKDEYVRPCLDLDISGLLMVSSADGGKDSAGVGPGALKQVAPNSSGEWKTTIKDSAREKFSAAAEKLYTDGLSVSYENAKTGAKEYLSAVIADSDGGVKYYGRIKELKTAADASGSVKVELNKRYDKGDKLYIFNEQMNGNRQTDYSSDMIEVTVPDKNTCRITISADPAEGGAPYALEPECETGDRTIIEPSANMGYTFKNWDVTVGDGKISQDSDGFWWLTAAEQDVELTAHYTYTPIDINDCEFFVPDVTYTGKPLEPEVEVYYNNLYQEPGSMYTVKYSNNVKVGTGIATVTGKGAFTGSIDLEFKIVDKEAVPQSKARISLSKKSYTYNGKARKPAVTVKVGDTTLAASDYTLTYEKGRKNVGKYKVTASLKGSYAGTVATSFKIKPRGTSVKSLKGKSKAVKVKWKKQSKKMRKSRITGYEILLATNSKFTADVKTVTVKGYKKTSKTVKKLKAKKKYYVKVRTYKTINGTKIYSGWSKVKTVKTKK